MPHRRKHASIGFDVRVLGWEIEEGEQRRFAILRQASDRLVVLGAVFVGEHVDRGHGRRTGRRAVNLAKVGFHIDLNRESDLVQHIPVALPPGRARLATRPLPIGSFAVAKTMGIADVAPLTATAAEPEVTMTSTLSATNSAARSA